MGYTKSCERAAPGGGMLDAKRLHASVAAGIPFSRRCDANRRSVPDSPTLPGQPSCGTTRRRDGSFSSLRRQHTLRVS